MNIVSVLSRGCKYTDSFTFWYLCIEDDLDEVFAIKEKKECTCGMFFLRECPHLGDTFCPECSHDTHHLLLEDDCLACIFEGSVKWENPYKSTEAILTNIALRVYGFGMIHRSCGKVMLPLKSRNGDVVAMYKLYKAGFIAWKSGSGTDSGAELEKN